MNKRKTTKKLRSRANLDKGLLNRGWHSKSYHRHFEGYTEVESVNSRGKVVIERIYTGDYYRLDLPRNKRVLLRLAYALLWLIACALFGFASSRPIGANTTWYLALVQMVTLCSLAIVLFSFISHCTAPREMTIGDWKSSSVNMKRRTGFTALVLALNALLTILYPLLESDYWGMHLLCTSFYVIAGILMVVINRLEAKTPYITFPSSQPVPEDGTYIDV